MHVLHRRKVYDTTGSLQDCEDMDSQEFGQLYKYYKDLYAFTTEDIDSFAVRRAASVWEGGQEPWGVC
jgi:hypothetical protein